MLLCKRAEDTGNPHADSMVLADLDLHELARDLVALRHGADVHHQRLQLQQCPRNLISDDMYQLLCY